jgi:pyruvate,water dikinase
VHPGRIEEEEVYRKIRKLTRGYSDLKAYFIDKLASGIAKIAASRYPDPVIVRTSDFKTNEYAGLIGGARFEPKEENPMLGWRHVVYRELSNGTAGAVREICGQPKAMWTTSGC